MATTEKKGLFTHIDAAGNKTLLYPVTIPEAVDGLAELLAGKAPNGYGLGAGQHTTDFNTCLSNGWYYGTSATAHAPNGFTTNCSCFVIARTASQIYQYFQYPNNGCVLQRYTKDGGATWIEEWVNPPMILGVEYRTTERWNGHPVYAKLVAFGYMPNATAGMTNWEPDSGAVSKVVRYAGVTGQGDALPYVTDSANYRLTVNPKYITIVTNYDKSTVIAYVAIWYTKD